MITTSYFGKLQYIQNPVAITVSKPKWFTGKHYSKLAPPKLLVQSYKNGEINQDEYTELYNEFVLDKLDPINTYKEIVDTFGNDATLLCYERSTDFCHRHLVRDWFNNTRFNVKELKF